MGRINSTGESFAILPNIDRQGITMNKIVLSTLTALALGNSSIQADNAGLYLGLGYAYTTIELGVSDDFLSLPAFDVATDSIVFLAGFDFNDWLGIEGRYYWNITSAVADEYNAYGLLDEYKAESFAFYAKPQYSFDVVSIYALLGVTMNDYTLLLQSSDDTLFSWGVGAKFNFTESFGAFADYTDLGESDLLLATGLSSWNFGITYKF